ncbi:MAG: helix-turn-helix transcriptional regulator [Burkholderia gladioli]
MRSIGYRLREERARLGLSQSSFAEVGGVKVRTQINYEQDDRSPDATYLAAIASAGVDVLYVITGNRTVDLSTLSSMPSDSFLRVTTMKEAEWLNGFEDLSEESKNALRGTKEALLNASCQEIKKRA